MFFFRNQKIGVKLGLLIVIATVGLAAFAAYAFYTLGVIRINGPIYQSLAQDQQLVADILPPPSYIIESYLLTSQILDAAGDNNTESIDVLVGKIAELQKVYESRHVYWTETLASSTREEVKQALLVDSYQSAEAYFQAYNDQFLPAIRSGQIEQAHNIYHQQLTQAYEAHRAAIDQVISLQNAAIKENETNAQALAGRSTFLMAFMAILTVILVIGLSIIISRSITLPVAQLTEVATQVSSGNLNARASADTTDEVGALAGAFNKMTARLQDLVGSLEQRVVERTQGLELAAEVGRSISQVRALDTMLTDAVELIRNRFNLYYVQIYLTDVHQSNLVLKSGTGNVGKQLIDRNHYLPLDPASINGRAAIDRQSIVISDTASSSFFRPNPLLPKTRSEMAVPLLVDENVVGVLDMQSEYAGSLSQETLPAFEVLAGQLAIAIRNASLLEETENARAEVERQARYLVRQNWSEYLDAIHAPESIGFVFEGNQVSTIASAEVAQPRQPEKTVTAPITVTGEPLGMLIVESENQSPEEVELVHVVARQVAQQIENLRIIENAERYRAEAEQASRRLTHEGWKAFTEDKAEEGLGFLYDTNNVQPVQNVEIDEEEGLILPLKVRDEPVGKMVIQGIGPDDQDARELAGAVAERLSAHIENLRLSGQIEKRAHHERILQEVTSRVSSSVTVETAMRRAVEEVGRLMGRKAFIKLVEKETPGKGATSQEHA